jgi:hypothetical protein
MLRCEGPLSRALVDRAAVQRLPMDGRTPDVCCRSPYMRRPGFPSPGLSRVIGPYGGLGAAIFALHGVEPGTRTRDGGFVGARVKATTTP